MTPSSPTAGEKETTRAIIPAYFEEGDHFPMPQIAPQRWSGGHRVGLGRLVGG